MNKKTTDCLFFTQHGWADDGTDLKKLAQQLLPRGSQIISPSLGYWQTWLRMEPLIERLSGVVEAVITNSPQASLKIIAHSMGGLLWLELLNRNPKWLQKTESLVLIASPVGGSDLARIIDPFDIGLGIARDLAVNRRRLAETIATQIPILVIAGDLSQGSDGTIPVESTKIDQAQFICLPGLAHATLKTHLGLVPIIHRFWDDPRILPISNADFARQIIHSLRLTPGMIDTDYRGFRRSQVILALRQGNTIRTWKNFAQIEHIFLADASDQCLYAGFISWRHQQPLRTTLKQIQQDYCPQLSTESSLT